MRVKSYLEEYFINIEEFVRMTAISRFNLIDVATPQKEGEKFLAKLKIPDKKLLTNIAYLLAAGDYQGAKALEGVLFLSLRAQFAFLPQRPVIRQGFAICLAKDNGDNANPDLDLAFDLTKIKTADPPSEDTMVRMLLHGEVGDPEYEFNPTGATLEVDDDFQKESSGESIRRKFLHDMGM